MAKISKRSVDALQPEAGRDILLWDDELPGFGVRCRPSGSKVYFLKYRTQGNRQRWLSLGQHGPLTPEAARAKALREKAAVADGGDPSGARQTKRRESTIAELADRYMTEHVEVHNKPSTASEVRRIVEKRIKPELGAIKITDLSRADIKAWHQRMSGMRYEANRSVAYLSKMLSLASHEWELRADNPCLGIKRFPERARERFFTDDEVVRLGQALAAMEQEAEEPPSFFLMVRLLATTGMRLGEALSLKWEYVDLAEGFIRLPDAKAGARTVPLGSAARAILDNAQERGVYVIPRRDEDEPLSASAAGKAWVRLRNKAGIPDARLHDWRHTAGTLAALGGANAFSIRDLLGHKTLAMTNRYVARAAELVRGTADSVSSRVSAALTAGEREPAKIAEMPKRTA
jgi:integrase